MLSSLGIKNFSKTGCSGLKMLIHPGLVQVNEATKIREADLLYLFLLSLFSQQFPNSFPVFCPRSQMIPGKMLLQIESAL